MEHRSVQRYRISIPTSFYWTAENSFFEGSGVSRDVSTRGAFILTSEMVPVGSEIWLKFAIPGIREGSRGSQMEGRGQIIRADAAGFAVDATIGFSMKNNH